MTESLAGQIEKVTFLNDETGFSIVMLKVDGKREAVTACGHLNAPSVGEIVDLTGDFKRHPRFGLQFEVATCSSRPPETENGLTKYLGSGLIKGVGPVLAKRMVDAFGQDVLNVLDTDPGRMAEVRGLGPVRRERVIEAWRSTAGIKQLLSFLSAFNLGPSLAVKILKKYGSEAEEIIRKDPYTLAYEISGVGFLTADKVATHLNFAPDCPQRLEAGLIYCLDEAVRDGHDFLPSGELIGAAKKLIPEATTAALELALSNIALTGRAMAEKRDEPGQMDVYPPETHRAENWVAKCLASILKAPFSASVPRPIKALAWSETTLGHELSDEQREAVIMAITEKCSIITGGPGTGKTTMTKAVCGIWKQVTAKLALVAPTGRAAKRLSQATGFEATTIHRLLQYVPSDGGFIHGPNNRLDLDMILVDEASMIDVLLMNQLLGALPSRVCLILIGDQDQLPPVGPGRVLPDMLASGLIPSKKLTKIYRQAERSCIVQAAHMINDGLSPAEMDRNPDADFFFVEEENPTGIIDKIVRLVCDRIPKKLGINPKTDVMVLSPTKKGELGTVNLNAQLGKALNPFFAPTIVRYGQTFRVNDRVMQVRNNYTKEVYNGDLGRVSDIDMENQELRVQFDDHKVNYDFSELDELSVAWASTVHKAQGSEFPAVVIPIHPSHHIMLRRKLIYTAVTRGRQMVLLVGSPAALLTAVKNNREDRRHSNLDRLLVQAINSGQ
ncbi:MAG: ATP-dependent RecD-like DNA helicase [Deltaproteobacteria bacterium]|jgi:exodeoxyribonuclease V alpha subunit|nr:ATP-dependent RecD-like DNA helicase [Deltaproteobacteria bacterium]